MKSPSIDKARKELENGNLWRAKEILQGAIRNGRYDVQLFEMMGTVLLRMGDLPEAGRFLFLSGVRKPEYLEPIEIFLSRHRKKQWQEFFHVLPRTARLRTVSDYPQEVGQTLREMDFPEILKDENGGVYQPQTSSDIVGWVTCGAIVSVALTLIILGVLKLWEMFG